LDSILIELVFAHWGVEECQIQLGASDGLEKSEAAYAEMFPRLKYVNE